ncbi:glucose oxidase [Xylaria grammica]|nr:glucose oxidase [Xylaria grammica]
MLSKGKTPIALGDPSSDRKFQFDAREELSNPGWNWNEFWPYFKKAEKMFSPEPWQVELGASIRPEDHGFDGELHGGYIITPRSTSFYSALQQSWARLGRPSYEDPVTRCPDLHLIGGTATRVVWADSDSRMRDRGDTEALGVEYVTPDDEVILSTDTFRAPLILECSGVGNPRLLKRIGIKPVDLPSVSENLVDQSNVPIMFKIGTGLHGSTPYIQHDLIFNKGVTLAEIFTTTYAGTVISTAAQLLPFSRGSIYLNDNSTAQENPAIDSKYLLVGFDMVSQIAAGRLASRLASTPPSSHPAVGGLLPPDDTDSSLPPLLIGAPDKEWQKWTADAISSDWYSMGTAAMMAREPDGVIGTRLAVYGMRRLRVVDASIMPTQLSRHPMATLYAIANRATDMMKSDAGAIFTKLVRSY